MILPSLLTWRKRWEEVILNLGGDLRLSNFSNEPMYFSFSFWMNFSIIHRDEIWNSCSEHGLKPNISLICRKTVWLNDGRENDSEREGKISALQISLFVWGRPFGVVNISVLCGEVSFIWMAVESLRRVSPMSFLGSLVLRDLWLTRKEMVHGWWAQRTWSRSNCWSTISKSSRLSASWLFRWMSFRIKRQLHLDFSINVGHPWTITMKTRLSGPHNVDIDCRRDQAQRHAAFKAETRNDRVSELMEKLVPSVHLHIQHERSCWGDFFGGSEQCDYQPHPSHVSLPVFQTLVIDEKGILIHRSESNLGFWFVGVEKMPVT